jgi:integrase
VTVRSRLPDRAASPGQPASLRGTASKALRLTFPARQVPDAWPATADHREQVITRLGRFPLRAGNRHTQGARCRGADKLLRWLESFPGDTWQQRWRASPAHDLGSCWLETPLAWLTDHGERAAELHHGLLALLCADAFRPDLGWVLVNCRSKNWRVAVASHRDPEGFARLEKKAGPELWSGELGRRARNQIGTLLIAKGGKVCDITVGDCLELRAAEAALTPNWANSRSLFYSLLQDLGNFPADAPSSLQFAETRTGQVSIEQLVDRYQLRCGPIRDVIVSYLAERQPVLDYNTLEQLSRILALHFWKNIEDHHPGADSLRLPPQIAAAWKQRCRTKTARRRQQDGTMTEIISPRINITELLTQVRAFYLDIAQWALEDPARWAPWAAPCPISQADAAARKHMTRRKARMDQRTRERLPVLPALVKTAAQRLSDARTRLDAAHATAPGQSFTVLGETFVKPPCAARANHNSPIVYDAAGRRRHLALAEHRAFWGWATVEFLRCTGCRVEEMMEVSHHSITQYTLPGTGELVPLLQITPSKTDEERLLVVSPELADVLSAIVCRVRDHTGAIPLLHSYDHHERTWNPPMPLLFQWRTGGQNRTVSVNTIRKALDEILLATGLTDTTGQPLHYQPHDFRRIFATETIQNGMPPHIAQLILGHKDINTTMGYKAVYPEETINGHRAFIARRRALRPSEEYRSPTDEEWEEFLGHFERRRVALGDCGRAYATSCIHEHSCIRCPLLRVDPAQRPRLAGIRENLTARITEAEREGWTGEAEGLKVSLAAATAKLAQADGLIARRAAAVHLGIPAYRDIVARTAAMPRPSA